MQSCRGVNLTKVSSCGTRWNLLQNCSQDSSSTTIIPASSDSLTHMWVSLSVLFRCPFYDFLNYLYLSRVLKRLILNNGSSQMTILSEVDPTFCGILVGENLSTAAPYKTSSKLNSSALLLWLNQKGKSMMTRSRHSRILSNSCFQSWKSTRRSKEDLNCSCSNWKIGLYKWRKGTKLCCQICPLLCINQIHFQDLNCRVREEDWLWLISMRRLTTNIIMTGILNYFPSRSSMSGWNRH